MKKFSIIFCVVFLLICSSCSQVFEAGISGRVVTFSSGSEEGVADVRIFAYSDESAYKSDLKLFEEGKITRPSDSLYVPTTTSSANGDFTINKIVWETKKSMFGKTADVTNLYLIFYHDDFKPCGYGPVTIISGSTNSSAVKQSIERVRFDMPAFESQINKGPVATENLQDENETNDYDNVRLILTDKDFKVYEGPFASVYTRSAEHGVDSLKYSHGHFARLGAGLKWTGDSIVVNIVWDANDNGQADSGEYYYPVTVTKSTTGIPSKITFTKTK